MTREATLKINLLESRFNCHFLKEVVLKINNVLKLEGKDNLSPR